MSDSGHGIRVRSNSAILLSCTANLLFRLAFFNSPALLDKRKGEIEAPDQAAALTQIKRLRIVDPVVKDVLGED